MYLKLKYTATSRSLPCCLDEMKNFNLLQPFTPVFRSFVLNFASRAFIFARVAVRADDVSFLLIISHNLLIAILLSNSSKMASNISVQFGFGLKRKQRFGPLPVRHSGQK